VKEIGRFFKRGLTLVPADREARELHAKLRDGAVMFVQLWTPRNMAQHRKYFAVLNNVVEATGEWTSTEDLRFEIFKQLKRGLLRVSQVDGSLDFIPDSMAVASRPRPLVLRIEPIFVVSTIRRVSVSQDRPPLSRQGCYSARTTKIVRGRRLAARPAKPGTPRDQPKTHLTRGWGNERPTSREQVSAGDPQRHRDTFLGRRAPLAWRVGRHGYSGR
jgi:hypothetical protein